MKTKVLIFTIIVLLGGLIITGCYDRDNTEENVRLEDQEMLDAKVQYENEWQQFKKDAESRIDASQTKIDEFKLAMDKTSAAFKTKYENEILSLEQKNIELKKKLNDFRYDGKDNWVEFKSRFFNDVESVENSINGIFENREGLSSK